ncbi:MAG: ferrous iron transport protein B [Anaerolineae bacterium]|nr:ferrous iron transport protein B [Anaerolineae bacterium]
MHTSRTARLALAGQPNVGKSTVFNILTGLTQHVGNWPGKTVEQRVGTFEHHGMMFSLVDLPGTYCLTAASPEEVIARDYIIHEQPDVVIVVINAASLERNLYLVAELLALPAPIVIGLNMMDVARQEGFQIEPQVLSAAIGVPVIPMVASRGQGLHELVDAAVKVAASGPEREPNRPEIRDDHRAVADQLRKLIEPQVPEPYPVDWVAMKLLEGDSEMMAMMQKRLPSEIWDEVGAVLHAHEDAIIAVAGGRYEWIRRMTRAALKRPRAGRITVTQRVDSVATHPFWGLVMLAIVLAAIFGLTYALGSPLQDWMAVRLIEPIARWTSEALSDGPPWLSGLIVDGVIGGVGTVLTFLPILALFFATMGLLEDVGYMARAAYVMDRFMHGVGLHGKSFMPLFLGFGCSVPAIMGTRIIESRRSRLLTILLAPLVPCTARLSVLAVLVPIFFPAYPTLISWALTALPILVLAIAGALIKGLFLRGELDAFIMELPLYHVPHLRTIGITVLNRLRSFLHKAGTVILVMSTAVWALAILPHGEIESSYLAIVGRALEPVGSLMGLTWRPLVAIFASFVAKENAVATLSVLYGVGESPSALAKVLSGEFTSASALAFLTAEMLFIPCVSTLAAIKQEAGSWKWVLIELALLGALTLVGSILAYHLALWVF